MPGLIVTCSATFGWDPWEACSILKGDRRGLDLGGREGEGRGEGLVGL